MPSRTAKITYTVVALAVAGLLVGTGSAVATIASVIPSAEAKPAPDTPERLVATSKASVEQSAAPVAAERSCAGGVYVTQDLPDGLPKLVGKPRDTGVREFATGAVEYDAEGTLAVYTVAAGDSESAIEDRFCWGGVLLDRSDGVSPDPSDRACEPLPGECHPGRRMLQPGDRISLDVRDFKIN